MMNTNSDAVKKIYEQRDKVIIIGLTGRTGAGCSTVAEILSRGYDKLDKRDYKTRDFQNADERKYRIVRQFLDGNKWVPFKVIQASAVIFSYVQDKKEETINYIEKICKEGELEISGWSEKLKDIFSDTVDGNNDRDINFYCKKMVELLDVFKSKTEKYVLRNIMQDGKDANLYSYFMQSIANNIRATGDPFGEGNYDIKHSTIIVEQICELIELEIKKEKTNTMDKVRICIDALRNPYEINYLRDRFCNFYAFAVNTDDPYRMRRLNMKSTELEGLDAVEYPEKFNENYEIFYHQNIQGCLEIADIYLYNPDVNDGKYFELTEKILKYIALILQPGLITPTHLERCMQLAFNAKYNSGCLSRQVGAVVTGEDFSIRSIGWNDVPKGQVSCNLRCVEDYCSNKDKETFSEFELTDGGVQETIQEIKRKLEKNKCNKKSSDKMNDRPYAFCFKDLYNGLKKNKNQVYTRSLHAEENAFLQIAKYGGAAIHGGKLFTTASPCELCSKKAYQLGIREIYYIDPYPGISRKHILTFGKNGNPEMILFEGAIGNAYISLFSPRMPYKDELELYTGTSTKQCAEEIVSKEKPSEEKRIESFLEISKEILGKKKENKQPDEIAKEMDLSDEIVKSVLELSEKVNGSGNNRTIG